MILFDFTTYAQHNSASNSLFSHNTYLKLVKYMLEELEHAHEHVYRMQKLFASELRMRKRNHCS